MTIAAAHKEWALVLRDKLGGDVVVTNYSDDTGQHTIPILSRANENGLVAATIGLMDLNQSASGQTPIATELLIVAQSHDERICKLLSSAALFMLKNGWKAAPGVVFETLVSRYYPDTNLPHLFFAVPVLLEGLDRITLQDRRIYPLFAIPVSERESELAKSNRGADLEALWERKGTNVMDWDRDSAL